jgi:hypothetical protein
VDDNDASFLSWCILRFLRKQAITTHLVQAHSMNKRKPQTLACTRKIGQPRKRVDVKKQFINEDLDNIAPVFAAAASNGKQKIMKSSTETTEAASVATSVFNPAPTAPPVVSVFATATTPTVRRPVPAVAAAASTALQKLFDAQCGTTVQDLAAWLTDTNRASNMCVVRGPPGCGKRTVVETACCLKNCDLHIMDAIDTWTDMQQFLMHGAAHGSSAMGSLLMGIVDPHGTKPRRQRVWYFYGLRDSPSTHAAVASLLRANNAHAFPGLVVVGMHDFCAATSALRTALAKTPALLIISGKPTRDLRQEARVETEQKLKLQPVLLHRGGTGTGPKSATTATATHTMPPIHTALQAVDWLSKVKSGGGGGGVVPFLPDIHAVTYLRNMFGAAVVFDMFWTAFLQRTITPHALCPRAKTVAVYGETNEVPCVVSVLNLRSWAEAVAASASASASSPSVLPLLAIMQASCVLQSSATYISCGGPTLFTRSKHRQEAAAAQRLRLAAMCIKTAKHATGSLPVLRL